MDASFAIAGLIEEFGNLLEARDFEGAEELLTRAMEKGSVYEPFLHFQMGRLYKQWNKLSSAINHLTTAAEIAKIRNDQMLLFQIVDELKQVKARQMDQRP